MAEYKKVDGAYLTGERALFGSEYLHITDTIFNDGESPLKESHDLILENCMFQWKYPLWYCKNVEVRNSTWFDMGRAGVWYTTDMRVSDCLIEGPKNFRRCRNLHFDNVTFTDAKETMWNCDGVKMDRINVRGDYFAMGSSNLVIDHMNLMGNYGFDGCKNLEIHNSRLITKDAFWNAENVTVYDSFISGEYLAWNAKNITFVNCTIESLQGLCYVENLVMKNCRLIHTTLAFEYSTVDAELRGHADSILNPKSGKIAVDTVGELILEPDKINPDDTEIIVREGIKK